MASQRHANKCLGSGGALLIAALIALGTGCDDDDPDAPPPGGSDGGSGNGSAGMLGSVGTRDGGGDAGSDGGAGTGGSDGGGGIDGGSGCVVRLGVLHSSGVEEFDIGALDAVFRAAPYPVAPEQIRSRDGVVYLRWEFYRRPDWACSMYFAHPSFLSM